MPEISYWTIREAGAALRRGDLSAEELTRHCLDRIERLDGALHSFITITADLALEQARAADGELRRGLDRGPLHGIPLAHKDLYATRGIRTTAASRVLEHWVPAEDATVITRLREAGSVLLGKLNMHEFADGGPVLDGPFPPAVNPWDSDRIPGGSSSGSAVALAAGLCYGSYGSDTGFSIRGPAAWTGVVGLKPTFGLVSRHGVVPLSWSLDHVGPMGRTVEDCALMLAGAAGYDPLDPMSEPVACPDFLAELGSGVAGLRLGVPSAWLEEGEGVDVEVRAAFEAALGVLMQLGAEVVDLPAGAFQAARRVHAAIRSAESYAYHGETLRSAPELLGISVRSRVLEGATVTAGEYIRAQQERASIRRRVMDVVSAVDAAVTPTSRTTAPRFSEFDSAYRPPNFTNVFNLTGLPALSVPCGFIPSGLPVGLQIACRPFGEGLLFRIGQAYEDATGWHRRWPPL